MLSYQHAYHAGNPADLHKHFVLAELLALLTRKDRGISYMETHAGRGLYDLSGDEAAKTGEAAMGIARVRLPEGPYGRAVAQTRAAYGPDAYPGSPMIAAQLLRPQDRMVLMELHPQEVAALKRAMRGHVAEIHRRDGREGVLALSPPQPRKGLVLVDPSYELKDEYADTAAFATVLMKKWPEATVVIWYPLLDAGRHRGTLGDLPDALVHEVGFSRKDGRGMYGSGLAILNPPWGTEDILAQVVPSLKPVLSARAAP